jgi:hypothetical protein
VVIVSCIGGSEGGRRSKIGLSSVWVAVLTGRRDKIKHGARAPVRADNGKERGTSDAMMQLKTTKP